MDPKLYVSAIKKAFAQASDDIIAEAQSKYMRNLFPFYGIKRPERNVIQSAFIKENGLPQQKALTPVLKLCFQAKNREVQYFALDVLMRCIKKQEESFVDVLEELIQTKSWWDSVDYLASICGKFFLIHETLVPIVTDQWIENEDFWLNRVAIIFQLHHKEKTDEALLYRYIKCHAASNEFFLQKACGWALRQHSKRFPDSVVSFIEGQDLSPLTVREGLKHINKSKKP